jgi:hypothetical protein
LSPERRETEVKEREERPGLDFESRIKKTVAGVTLKTVNRREAAVCKKVKETRWAWFKKLVTYEEQYLIYDI